jgi:TM2 domain-containing membrane protein YozV
MREKYNVTRVVANRVKLYAYLTRLYMLNWHYSMKYHKLYNMGKLKGMLALAIGELHLFTVSSLCEIYVVDVIDYWRVLHGCYGK